MSTGLAEAGMAKKSSPVRLTEEALRVARIASGYTGESVVEYVSRIVTERGTADVEKFHAEFRQPPKPKGRGDSKN